MCAFVGVFMAIAGGIADAYEWASFLWLHPRLWLVSGLCIFFVATIKILWPFMWGQQKKEKVLEETVHFVDLEKYRTTQTKKGNVSVEIDTEQIKLFRGQESYEIHMLAVLYNDSEYPVSVRFFLKIGNERCQTSYGNEPCGQHYILLEPGKHVQKPLGFWFRFNPSELDSKLICCDLQDTELFKQSLRLPKSV